MKYKMFVVMRLMLIGVMENRLNVFIFCFLGSDVFVVRIRLLRRISGDELIMVIVLLRMV